MLFRVSWHKLDHYRRAALLSFPCTLLLLLFLLLMGVDLFFSEWYLDLIPLPAFIGSYLSAATYFGKQTDLFAAENKKLKYEKWFTLTGILLGFSIGITLSVFSPFSTCLNIVQAGLLTVNCINQFGSLGNRLGSTLDQNHRLPLEKKTLSIAMLVGVTLSIILLATASCAMVSVVGVTSFITGGAALPFWINGIIFVGSFSSGFASAGDYIAKAFIFIKSQVTEDAEVKKAVAGRPHEYRGSFLGINAGLIIGAVIITALSLAMPQVLAGLAGVVIAIVILTTCMSVIGGLCSRIGRLLDGLNPPLPIKEVTHEKPPLQKSHSSVARLTKTFVKKPLIRSASEPILNKNQKHPPLYSPRFLGNNEIKTASPCLSQTVTDKKRAYACRY